MRRLKHLLVSEDEELVGYAQLASGPEWSAGQLVVAPDHRRQGIGTQLLQRLIMESTTPLRVWAMGDTPAARALAAGAGMVRRRELLIMERPLDGELPEPVVPRGVRIRTFEAGQDEQEWLRVNAAAFAQHPEQALIDIDDLKDRMAEPWFDPTGFFVAMRDNAMIGFHWTKQHRRSARRGLRARCRSLGCRTRTWQGLAADRFAFAARTRQHQGGALRGGRPRGGDPAISHVWLRYSKP